MSFEPRLLAGDPVTTVDEHRARGGGDGLDAARRLGLDGMLDELEAAGLRGRGGAGFPTGVKWRTIAAQRGTSPTMTVVVNAAEGEPGTFKDRALLRHNPFLVLEGLLIAAELFDANAAVVAIKETFTAEHDRLNDAIRQLDEAGWVGGRRVEIVAGPTDYLFGEETGLLEVLAGRPPFPRLAPPYTKGVLPPDGPQPDRAAADAPERAQPTLVNNVETWANVPLIAARGADWFRSAGTDASPGTVVVTISGDTVLHGVGEVPMGTPLRAAIDLIGEGPNDGRRIRAALSGVANPIIPAQLLDVPLCYDAMRDAGTGLGAAGFIVVDDDRDMAAVAHGVARFLAVESCGQCTPCKEGGLEVAAEMDKVRRSAAAEFDRLVLDDRLGSLTVGARCFLAQQHQDVVRSILRLFPEEITAHVDGIVDAADEYLVAPIVDLEHHRFRLDTDQATKQPDWSHDEPWSGASPVELAASPVR